MRCSAYLPLSLITASIVFVAPQQAKAISSAEVAQMAKGITVKIDRVNSREYGSGFIIKKDGDTYHVLTAYHVVGQAGKYTLTAPDGEQYNLDYKNFKYKSGTDLAVVQFTTSKSYSVAKIGDSDKATEGTISYVAGFWPPTGSLPISTFRFIEGKITAIATRPVDEGYQIVYSNNTTGGVSGGAVFNENGEVVAIHGRGEQKLDTNSPGELRTISTGNNIGIAVNTFLRLELVDVGVKAPPLQVAVAPKADDFLLQGNDKFRKRDYQGAIADLDKAIAINPQLWQAHTLRGAAHYSLKQYPEVITDLDKAIIINPQLAEAYALRGYARLLLKQYPEALTDSDKAIIINPELVEAYVLRGAARAALKQYREAVADYNRAIAIDPEYTELYALRGAIYALNKQYSEAIADYDRAIAINPQYPATYAIRGAMRKELKQYREAIADLSKAIELNPKYALAYYNRALVLRALKQYREAIADFNKAIEIDSKYAPAYINRGFVRQELKQYPQALDDFDKAIALNPEYAAPYINQGLIYYENRDVETAITKWQKAISIDEQLAEPKLALGVALYTQGKQDEGLKLAKAALNLDKQFGNLDHLKKNLWGERLRDDAKKLLQDPQIKPLQKTDAVINDTQTPRLNTVERRRLLEREWLERGNLRHGVR